jgi:hypothetical protein
MLDKDSDNRISIDEVLQHKFFMPTEENTWKCEIYKLGKMNSKIFIDLYLIYWLIYTFVNLKFDDFEVDTLFISELK